MSACFPTTCRSLVNGCSSTWASRYPRSTRLRQRPRCSSWRVSARPTRTNWKLCRHLKSSRGGRMRFVDEFRSADKAHALAAKIAGLCEPGRQYKLMEVCGGHTHTIYSSKE